MWHANRTDLGWVTKGVLSTMQAGKRAERRKLLANLPITPEIRERAAAMRREGYADVTDLMAGPLIEAVAATADAKLARLDELAAKQQLGHKSFWVSLLDEDLVGGAFPTDHPFVRFALQPTALAFISAMLGDLPQLSDVLLTLSRPAPGEKLSYSQLWHLDHDDKRVCKLFIYLTDVKSVADGPFTFIPAPQSNAFHNTLHSHMSDEVVFRKVDRNAVKEMVAPKLSCFMVNTAACLHMGSRIHPGHTRLLYTATYLQPPRIYPEPPPRFRPVGTLSAVEQAVLKY